MVQNRKLQQSNLKGSPSIHAPPYWICSECEKEGYDSDLHHLAFSHFNLTENLTLKEVFDEDWDNENLKSLQKKQFDIILGEPPYLELDYTYPHIEYFWALVVPVPEEMPPITRRDFIIYSVNNEFQITSPTYQINMNEYLELEGINMPDMYLFDLDEYNLSDFIISTYRHRFFNPRAKFILVGSELNYTIPEILICNFILNVIFIEKSTEIIFTIFPYDERMLHNPSKDWWKISSSTECTKEVFFQTLFQQKIPKIWNNSTISLMYIGFVPFIICSECEERGSLIDILEESVTHLNLTVEYNELKYNGSDFEEYDRNMILEKKYEISLGDYTDLKLDNLYPHDYTILFWVVPVPEEMPRWKYLFTVFSKQVWIVWIITFVTLVLTCFIISSMSSRMPSPYRLLTDAATIIKMSLEQSADLNSFSHSESILSILIYFFTCIMTAIYKSRFLYLLVGFNYEKIINSVEDIMDHNLTICSPMLTAVQGPFLETERKQNYFNSHYIHCDFGDTVYTRVATERDVTFVDNAEALNYLQSNYIDDQGKSLFRKVEQPIISSPFGSTLIKGHPITENLNRYFMLLDQHGIKKLIISRYNKLPFGQVANLQTQLY
ncbi:uncharacterized protein LOC123316665 [Coccinella septempunctata]|uniref:uncharacterized protein LOC123316665 n=1 Tax=Coccinella septempunctata TaxID=41139 RepID=UPI001D08D06E|nr:uncharacterized protein LOC123316665 [Coccinella septempunctata]